MSNSKSKFNINRIFNIDEESKKEMLHELKIVNGLIPDDDKEVKNLNNYFKSLGI